MIDPLASYALYYSGLGLEAGLLVTILRRRVWKRLAGPFLYVLLIFAVDALLRPLVQYVYCPGSREYYAFYWYTDAALVLAVLLLAGAFIHSASRHDRRMRAIYLLFVGALLLSAGLYLFGPRRNYADRWIALVYGLSGVLLICNMVICVLAWVLLRSSRAVEAELKLLVAGLAVSLAGSGIGWGSHILWPGGFHGIPEFVSGMCALMFFLLWWKAVILSSSPARA